MFKIIRASVLILLLACSAQAGEIQNGSPQPTPPPPPPTELAQEETMTGEAEGDSTYDLADTLTEAALSVLDNVLALL
ncbi:MAG: hypothetical protein LC795_14225 [Acidobacteria bacterium]|nr:hypothetical protein [Acidobacteriota bacterium]MCA1620436.1 hypothetical protein [Acidobacteriota bacterium]